MPEIKRTFTAGKMNKDLDERLVRNGEYRDALNIQVRTTSGEDGIGDAGVVQNIKGNVNRGLSHITYTYLEQTTQVQIQGEIERYTKFVGCVADEKNDKAYFFAAAPLLEGGFDSITHTSIMGPFSGNTDAVLADQGGRLRHWVDSIIELDTITETSRPIFVDKYGVTGRLNDIIGINNVPSVSSFSQLEVLDGSTYRVGMIVYFYNNEGEHLFFNSEGGFGVEILDIQENTLILAAEQNVNLNDELQANNIDYRSAFKFIYPERVLEFDYNSLIPNINIIDNLIFYTDGKNEPKKINITRSLRGTIIPKLGNSEEDIAMIQTADSYLENPKHTKLFVNNTTTDALPEFVVVGDLEWSLKTSDIKKEHVTVIRKAPVSPPTLIMSNTDRDSEINFPLEYEDFIIDGEPVPEFGETRVIVNDDLIDYDIRVNDVLRFTNQSNTVNPAVITARVIEFNGNTLEIQLTFVDEDLLSQDPTTWVVEIEQERPLFETKFGRVGYRYQYDDNEYSSFSPWSELAFLPGNFLYTPSKGYNVGMSNNVRELIVKDFIPDDSIRPTDVKKVDILWKTTDDQNVYIIKSITRARDKEWNVQEDETTGSLTLTSEMIHRVLSNEQLLRSWDNVPKTAKTQEITASRLVFGNYTQGYDINRIVDLEQTLLSQPVNFPTPLKSVKSIRSYKFGLVFGDEYGRETPVLARGYNVDVNAGATGDISVDKSLSSFSNKFRLKQNWETEPEEWMDYVKYYVKETSNEYYNLILDRWYNAEDSANTVWLSFPSVDRNKVDEETYLILKGEHGGQNPVIERARYKIIAIENEAPDFIKTDYRKFERVQINFENVFTNIETTTGIPDKLFGVTKIRTDQNYWTFSDNPSIKREDFKGIPKVRIVGESVNNPTIKHNGPWRTVSRIKDNGENRGCDIAKEYTEPEVNMYNALFPIDSTIVDTNNDINYFMEFRDEIVENKPEFDGRFFVKIERDDVLDEKVLSINGNVTYQQDLVVSLGYITNKAQNDAVVVEAGNLNWETIAGWDTTNIESIQDQPVGRLDFDGSPGGDIEIEADGGRIPKFGPGDSQRTEDFWNYWDNNKTSKIFIDAVPAHKNFNKSWSNENIQNNQTFDHLKYFDSKNIYGDVNPGEGVALPISLHYNETNYAGKNWSEGVGTTEITFAYGYQNYAAYQDIKNWHPAGLSRGLASEGLGQLTISCVGEKPGKFGEPGTDEQVFKVNMQAPGQLFRFVNDPNETVYKVIFNEIDYNFGQYQDEMEGELSIDSKNYDTGGVEEGLANRHSIIVRFVRLNTNGEEVIINGQPAGMDVSQWDPRGTVLHNGIETLDIELLTRLNNDELLEDNILTDKAIFETEPKEDIDIDIYYEASGAVPMNLREDNIRYFVSRNEKPSLASTFNILPRRLNDGSFENVNIESISYVFDTIGKDALALATNLKIENDNGDIIEEFDEFGNLLVTNVNFPSAQGIALNDLISFNHPNGLATRSKIVDHLRAIDINSDGNIDTTVPSNRFTASPLTINEGDTLLTFYASLGIPNVGDQVIGNNVENGTFVTAVSNISFPDQTAGVQVSFNKAFQVSQQNASLTFISVTGYFQIDTEVWKYPVELAWFNCYSFGNGVESDRIRDDFNAPTIDNGIKASSTFLDYKEETIGSGLIHSSELYNATSSVNGLNEFSMAQKITKNLNPVYGSIQALKTRDTNLVTFCEDKVLKILANKDAVFNADGNPQLTATNRVLGQTIPFAGDYGISKNPESLAADQYRMYFTDKQRGAVLRLSGDGLTPISNVSMKTYFRENLRDCNSIVGTFDTENGEYNATLNFNEQSQKNPITVSFNEGGKAWVSFKSFLPNCGVSVSGKYFTSPTIEQSLEASSNVLIGCASSKIWMHNANQQRNNFYRIGFPSNIEVVFNDMPSIIKSFKAVNYEGTQSRVIENDSTLYGGDGEYYNIEGKDGWYVNEFNTNTQSGEVREFLEKEGKWFNYIIGDVDMSGDVSDYVDPSEFSVQGIGFPLLIGEGFAQSQATLEIEVEPPTINPQINEADEDTVELEFVENTVNYQIPLDDGSTVSMFNWSQVSMPGASTTIGNFPELVEIYNPGVTRFYITYKVQFNYNGGAAFIDENNDEYLEVAIIKNGVALPIITQGVGENAQLEFDDAQGFSFGPEIRAYKINSNTYEYQLQSARNSNMFSNASGVGNFSTTIFIGDIYQLQFSDDNNNVGTKTITLTGNYVNPDPADVPLVDWKPFPGGDGQITTEGTIGTGDNDINDSYTGPLGVQVNLGLAFGPNQDQEATDQEPTDILD